jgi:hypothetical protein
MMDDTSVSDAEYDRRYEALEKMKEFRNEYEENVEALRNIFERKLEDESDADARHDIQKKMEKMIGDETNKFRSSILQYGNGRKKGDDRGLSTFQIDNIMRKYPDYLGCIAIDEIGTLDIKPNTRFGFVMNTDRHDQPGSHWVAIYCDARPNGDHSLEYYNSLADLPTKSIFRDLKMVAYKAGSDDLTFKVNQIADQSDTSSNCGYFAARFLIDRFHGISFAQASGYDHDTVIGEKKVEVFKRTHKPFTSVKNYGQDGEGFRDIWNKGVSLVKRGYEAVKKRVQDVLAGVREYASPSVRSFLEKHGDEEIVEMKICRKPIFTVIERLANLLSSGKWEENKEKLSYDKMFHLFVLIRLKSGSVVKLEKNHVVQIVGSSWNTDSETEVMPFQTDSAIMTINGCLKKAESREGASRLWKYDAVKQNCQYFIKWCFESFPGWTAEVDKFVLQNAEKVLEGLGLLEKAAKVVTDIAAVADVALQGAGKHRRGRGGRR